MNVVIMRLRFWFITSAGLNLILAAAFVFMSLRSSAPLQEENHSPAPAPGPGSEAPPAVRTNTVLRHLDITWAQIQSTNLAAYIANLQALGCPKSTIRDIIIAEVNQPFARRRATEVLTPDQQWWKTEPDPAVARNAGAQLREMETRRRAMLSSLLGPNWETETDVAAWVESNYGLTGPHLGTLPPETKRALYDIAAGAQEDISGQGRRGRRGNAAGSLQSERDKLRTWLTPVALTEYLLRYSETAALLREDTRSVAFTPQQFQTLFAAVDPILLQPDYYYQGTDADSLARQRALQAQYEAALQQSLGDDIYHALRLNQDPLYVSTTAAIQQAGIPAQDFAKLYEIYAATQAELDRIRNDATLTSDEKITAISATRAEQQKAVRQLIGADAFQRWLQTQTRP
jgi:hypothetical protein